LEGLAEQINWIIALSGYHRRILSAGHTRRPVREMEDDIAEHGSQLVEQRLINHRKSPYRRKDETRLRLAPSQHNSLLGRN
jgi:hypothetical protein